ncbi:acyl-CoA dehydrogenase [Mycolicibacterium rhodesiae]|uniref:acyl-CoA dehydrogenase n=1 Tax=Mycolicibacterium rhodesiae TaxID=36814 RepID=UPI00059B6732|nr:acyl-CoA dehydrogenase [Mycolicibacterium rhodesiae]
MPIGLTPEQGQLQEAVGRFAARHAAVDQTRDSFEALAEGALPKWWNDLVSHGFHAVHLPDGVGGQGGSLLDAACVIESASAALLPGPLLPTVIAGAIVLSVDDMAAAKLLSELAAGATATVVLPESGDLSATATDGGWRVTGASGDVLGVRSAAVILAAARRDDGETLWFVLDPEVASASVEQRDGTDLTIDVGMLRLADHVVPEALVLNGIDDDAAWDITVALSACASAGTLQWAVDAVTEHLRTREQFGKPIGTFQALQHEAAMLLVNSELAAAAAWDAVRAVAEAPEQRQLAAAGAAIMAVAPAPELLLDALTMFGAIGFTWEHDVHLYWRRATSLAASMGPITGWSRRLGELSKTHVRDMTVKIGEAEADFRAGIAAVLDEALGLVNDKPSPLGDYDHLASGPQRTLIADAGLMAPHWPPPWGLGATPLQQLIIDDEFAKRPELVRPSLNIAEWVLPSIISSGSEVVQQQLIPPTQRGELLWCQLFSEPGAGSDLAALSTRAVKVDGGWRINGHKIWTSSAQYADYGALLARTDPDAPKHKGIGYFIIDMRADGVEIQPIKTADRDPHFNEVFLADVFVPDEMLLGGPTDGWSLAIATMAQERVAIGAYVNIDRAIALRRLAAQRGPDQDAVVRALGELDAYTNAIKALGVRETIRLLDGQSAGPASSIAKVATSIMLRRTFKATLELAGPLAMVERSEPAIVAPYLRLPAELIGGGTRQIQLNIIAQMIMGLPRK